ncbi:type IV secretion system protein (plasmid) [Paraburkholderia sprentiae WSM5005]|uniref:Type IV secretion system protein n=1 Tax=Paraburkholderia sprentiae WSM5005 TaxID=754502 RepID=A0ACA8AXF0_9BURK|nr:type IV secretion system protein [Paraburkholderia sprentiae]APA90385.1 type IV secretion system protein [Paraburkholderia sprentiae WSM5005]
MLRYLNRIFLTLLVPLCVLACPRVAFADDPTTLPDGTVVPASNVPSPSTSAVSAASLVKPGELGKGASKAITTITAMFASVVSTAADVSRSISQESDKFASGLAVLTIVLAAIRFAATKDPVMAWVALFEELGMLGIFASFYIGYATWVPSFYKWFQTLSSEIAGGTNMGSSLSIIGNAASQLFDSVVLAFKGAGWTEYISVLVGVVPLLAAYLLLSVTAVVFLFFINVGQLQFACGAVMGQIAFALGFSSFTRSYFKSWLDFMISAGMYMVVAAIMMKLVTGTLVNAVHDAAAAGLSTALSAGYVFDLAVFVFLVSFEIPKIAGMFGGGTGVTGGALAKLAKPLL